MAIPASTAVDPSIDRPARPRPPIAWWPVGGAMAVVVGLLAATSAQYGYHRDELYFLMLAPGWGFVDQPPLTPLLARGAAALFGNTPTGVRVPAMLCVALGILLVALTARELGGGRGAQTLAAWGYGFAAVPMLAGHLMVTATVDNTLWAAVLLLVTRALLRDEPRWWMLAGLVVGVSLYNKLLIVLLLISLLIGLLVLGPRSVLRSRGVLAGVGIALVVGSPNLVYQITHHFPQLTMAGAISDKGTRLELIPFQFLEVGLPLLGITIAGFRALLRRPEWRALRALPIAYVASVVITLIGGGQIYYPFGLLAYVFVAGTIPTVEAINAAKTRARRNRVVGLVALNAVITILIALPVLPVTVVGHSPVIALNPTVGDEVGWPTYVRTVASVYESLPADTKAHSVIVTGNYGEAGSIVRYGPAYGLPSVYSGHNELWYHGPPPATATTVIAWTEDPDRTESILAGCRVGATMDNGVGVDNEEQGSAVLVCQVPAAGWAATWPKLQHYD